MTSKVGERSAEQVYAEARADYGIDADLEEFLRAVEGSRTVLEIQQELREERARVKNTLSRMGLRDPKGHWPPVDLEERIETIRDGEVPRGD